jgi:alanine dehydrogenase
MIVGTVKEIKRHEYRVGLTPECVRSYVAHGHDVLVQRDAGAPAGFADAEYAAAGARLLDTAAEVYGQADMVVKVKEPLPEEYPFLRSDLVLYTYLHLAANEELTRQMLASGAAGVAYETMQTDTGLLPCLKPMSQVAGRLAVQEGAKYLEKRFGGRGILLGGVPGVARGKVAILGGGTVGLSACAIAVGLGADVTVLDIDAEKLEYIDHIYPGRVTTLYSTRANIESTIADCDLLIGAVLVRGARAPHLVSREQLKLMKTGAVIVDVAVDQGGCIESTHPTTHDDPIFVVDGIVHYCVANMPGAVALTATRALTSSTLRYGLKLADLGLKGACRESAVLARGVNTYQGACTCQGVADAFGLECVPLADLLG